MKFAIPIPAVDKIYGAMGTAGAGSTMNSSVTELILELRDEALGLIEAYCAWRIVDLQILDKNQVTLDERFKITCSTRFFNGANRAAVLVITLGPSLERETSRLFKENQYLEAMIYDACGVAALNALLDLAREKISLSAEKDEKIGYSLSPGCHSIPLGTQQVIFSLLEPKKIGVSLNAVNLMSPVKSLSAIIPIGTAVAMQKNSGQACEICNLQKTCSFRAG